MNYTDEDYAKFQTLEDLEKELFTDEEIAVLNKEAEARSKKRKQLAEDVSKAVIQYMAENNLGFNQFKKKLKMSSATLSKIIKGQANLTLDSLVAISQCTGWDVKLTFSHKNS
jgi:antitoxin component HigA of HigAB toxin-antitoxin module